MARSATFSENPPKKYEDIVQRPISTRGAPFRHWWLALRDIVLFWAGEGVRLLRVDNPHTKPAAFRSG